MATSQAHLVRKAEALFQRRTSPRRKLLSLVLQRTEHFSAEEIAKAMPKVGRATVYRTLAQLVAAGLVCRVLLAALILLIVMRVMGMRMPTDWRVWAAFFGMGLLNNVIPFSLIVWGQAHIASGVALILNATTPLFTVVVAHFFTTDENMTPGRLVGVIAGLLGVAVMIGSDALRALGVDVVAQLACLSGALSYAFAGVFGRRFRRLGITPMATATGQVTASSMILLPVMLVVDQPWTLPVPSFATIGALVGVSALSTALAYILYFRILATAGATNLLLVTFLLPVSAILLGVVVLDEVLLLKHLLDAVI